MYGCVCDPGYEGYDCSEISCPMGDDPITAGVDEAQLLECTCAATCSGSFTLTFRDQTTESIPHDASEELVEYYLNRLSAVTGVAVSFTGGDRVCSGGGITSTITFLFEHGNLDALSFTSSLSSTGVTPSLATYTDGASSTIHGITSVKGTKESVECNNRGSCDTTTGRCFCYEDFSSSNGRDSEGNSGDCGYYNGTGLTTCPYATPLWSSSATPSECSGVKESCSSDYICNCTAGYTGPACEYMECPKGFAWFDEPNPAGTHRNGTACSNKGLCSRTAGTCTCDSAFALFEGDACHKMACPNVEGFTCGDGRGVCMTMRQLARRSMNNGVLVGASYTDAWDAAKIQGCYCYKAASATNLNLTIAPLPSGEESLRPITYIGPQAYAFTDISGYDCSQSKCPAGDDIYTFGVNEVQLINCTATSGNFRIKFREKVTANIAYDANQSQVEAALEALYTIGDVAVIFTNSTSTTACHSSNTIEVEFLTELGDLPLMHGYGVDLNEYTGTAYSPAWSGFVNVTESTPGTKENVECNARGTCDRTTGTCACFGGFFSSDHQGGPGAYGDCGFRTESTEPYRSTDE